MIRCRFSRLGGDGSDSEDLPLNDDLWLMFGTRADGKHMHEVFVCVCVCWCVVVQQNNIQCIKLTIIKMFSNFVKCFPLLMSIKESIWCVHI